MTREEAIHIAGNLQVHGSDGWTRPKLTERIAGELLKADRNSIDAICKSIGEWHRHIFGEYDPSDHVRAIAQKAEEESRELYASPTDPMEAADLIICGLAALDRMGYFPSEMVHEKLEVLKGRGVTQLERDRERGIVQARDCSSVTLTDSNAFK